MSTSFPPNSPDWVDSLLSRAREIRPSDHEKVLAETLIKQAYENATVTNTPIGLSIAAAFDLFIAVEYYGRITNSGWIYCPQGDPMLFYPFVNACPRCLLSNEFHYQKANKPQSGSIGATTTRLLCVFLECLFKRSGLSIQLYRGAEPVDVIIRDDSRNIILLAEVKAAPLTTPALAVSIEHQTDIGKEGHEVIRHIHSEESNPFLNTSVLCMFLPSGEPEREVYRLIEFGTRGNESPVDWAYRQILKRFGEDDRLFADFFHFWERAFRAYDRAERQKGQTIDPIYWLTNGCGQPSPRPAHWKRTREGGFESISDSKSSVGMDRTDDIKKGIYQVLKIGAESKPHTKYAVKTALLSNIHAVRHHGEYLEVLQDIVWAIDDSKTRTGDKRSEDAGTLVARDLPPETPIHNLFDGIVSFTNVYSRDRWIDDTFAF